ncbi:hypothetical protein WJX73_001035 [Symbiochloris irregularis]|uniref:Protein SDA1 n=1 Tax=Symbiochloris irregularis TaxID=706552 RepID=A0AAW1NL10_9CHLO
MTTANLLALQGSIKRDSEGYVEDFDAQLRRYRACLEIFALKPSQQPKDFGDLITFLGQVHGCYPQRMKGFAAELMQLLENSWAFLDASLRLAVMRALILMRNRAQIPATDWFPFLVRMLQCSDKTLRALMCHHFYTDIKRVNQKHRNDQLNRSVQNLLFTAVANSQEKVARKALSIIVNLWRSRVWRDARTVSIIASALVHPSMSVALPALKFFLGQDEIAEAGDDSGDEGEGAAGGTTVAAPTRADIYKATSKGTVSSKKKKKAKLQRVMATVKKASRRGQQDQAQSFAAIQLLHDPQGVAEQLLARMLRSGGERWEAKLALLQVTSRIVGTHRLLLLGLYPLLQKYLHPHQRDAPAILAVLVQACHDLVPPDTLQPVLRQVVDGFVHDRARPEVMTLGLRSVRGMCARTPLVMNPDLLQDLALYRTFREKEVASAARSLISLFRELAPGMLEKRDRGRGADITLQPMAYGSHKAIERIPGAELLEAELACGGQSDEDQSADGSESDNDDESADGDESADEVEAVEGLSDGGGLSGDESEQSLEEAEAELEDDVSEAEGDESEDDVDEAAEQQPPSAEQQSTDPSAMPSAPRDDVTAPDVPLEYGRFLTAEDFDRIRELRQQKMVDAAMAKHGLKSSSKRAKLLAAAQDDAEEALEALDHRGMEGESRVDPSTLQGRHRARKDKEARMATVLQGREGNEYGSAAGRKKQKVGGSSNKQKANRKNMPLAARRSKATKRTISKNSKAGSKNFKGRLKRSRN